MSDILKVEIPESFKTIKPSKRPFIFISGPIAPIEKINRTKELNIRIANDAAKELFSITEGRADIYIPHNLYTYHDLDEFMTDRIEIEDSYFYSFDLGIMESVISHRKYFCQYLMRDWAMSKGAQIERAFIQTQQRLWSYPEIAIAYFTLDVQRWMQDIGALNGKI